MLPLAYIQCCQYTKLAATRLYTIAYMQCCHLPTLSAIRGSVLPPTYTQPRTHAYTPTHTSCSLPVYTGPTQPSSPHVSALRCLLCRPGRQRQRAAYAPTHPPAKATQALMLGRYSHARKHTTHTITHTWAYIRILHICLQKREDTSPHAWEVHN
jgi:hypothetical protein